MAYKRQYSAAEKAEFAAERERNIRQASNTIIGQFQSGDLPAKLAPLFLNVKDGKPMNRWSLSNQLLVLMSGTEDARCYRDWQKAGRQVRKGEKATVFILEPNRITIREEDADTGEEKTKSWIKGFKVGKRFAIEQTDITTCSPRKGTTKCTRCGTQITDPDATCSKAEELWNAASGKDEKTQKFLDNLPLLDVAEAWGLKVAAMNAQSWGGAQGRYWKRSDGSTGIAVGVENLATWAHELCHSADDKLNNLVERGQHHVSETVAELGGAILLRCLGYTREADVGGAWEYIRSYCKSAKAEPIKVCMQVLKRVGEAVNLILQTAEHAQASGSMPSAVAISA